MGSSAVYARLLRRELHERNCKFKAKYRLSGQYSYGSSPVVVYEPAGDRHGNFHCASYQQILANDAWLKRLGKVHTSARVSLPRSDRKWCELDSSNSSDALLMNVFCYRGILGNRRVLSLL